MSQRGGVHGAGSFTQWDVIYGGNLELYLGALDGGGGGPDVACRIFKTAMSHVSVARKIAVSHVTNEKYPCRMSL